MSAAASTAAANGWSGTRRRLRGRWLLVLLVVAGLHVLLMMLAQRAMRSPPARPAPTQAPLVLVWVQPPTPVPLQAAPPPRQAPTPRPTRRLPQPSVSAEPAPVQAAAGASAASAAPPTAQAAASAPAGGLLDTEASRQAIREAARQRSTGERGAQATGEKAPLSEQDRMGQEIARGARGDCLKGEYAGAGMGLFSLPFWLIAELREKCRR
jgi:hypothetical protein